MSNKMSNHQRKNDEEKEDDDDDVSMTTNKSLNLINFLLFNFVEWWCLKK